MITDRPKRPSTLVGVAALAATVLLWSLFALSTWGLGASTLTTVDAALLRFGVPLIVLAPWIPRTVRAVRRERAAALVLVLAGGLPHFLVFALGAGLTSAALTGLLVPGTVPLFVTGIVFAWRRQAIPVRKLVALGAIVIGVIAIAVLSGSGSSLSGMAALLAAGLVWAVYTIGLQRTGLDLKAVIVLVSATSTAAAGVLALTGALPSNLLAGHALPSDVLTFALLQGIGTGLLSTTCYALAVRRLGGSTAAVAGALSPVLTALVAVPVFGEQPTLGVGVGMIFIVTGVVVFNLGRSARRRRGQPVAGAPGLALGVR